jgi:hypothetical protein
LGDFSASGLVPFIPSLILLAVVAIARRSPLVTNWQSALGKRVIVFVLPCVTFYLPVLLDESARPYVRVESVVASGLEWVALFEIASRLKDRLTSRTGTKVAILAVVVWVLQGPVFLALFEGVSAVSGRGFIPLTDLPGALSTSYMSRFSDRYGILSLLSVATLLILAFALGGSKGSPARRGKTPFWQSTHFSGTGGFHDMDMSPSRSHTTRLLCASAFLNGAAFRRKVLQYLEDRSRAVAPEIGMDLRLVAQMCKYAQDREQRFDWLFSGCILVGLVAALIDPTLGLFVLILSAGGVWFAKTWPEHFTFVRSFSKPVFDPDKVAKEFTAHLEPEHLSSLAPAEQNLVVYQGFSPFVGAGTSLGGWSFVVNVTNGKEEAGDKLEALPFTSAELDTHIEQSLDTLGLKGLSQQTMFYVQGSDIRDDRQLLPNSYGRPVATLEAGRAKEYFAQNSSHVRQYKWIRVTDWGNELTTSYFLRCTQRGANLFVEINRYLLTPLAEAYRTVDARGEEDWKKRIGLFAGSLVVGPFRALAAPFLLFGRLQEWIGELFDRKETHRQEFIDEHPLYNYGVAQSFREAVCSGSFLHYFQKLDGDFYSKVLEREILGAIVSFLDEHNIDTSELKERQSTILNSGIIIHGGDVKAESLAVGTGAQAFQISKPQPPAKPRFRRAAAGSAA